MRQAAAYTRQARGETSPAAIGVQQAGPSRIALREPQYYIEESIPTIPPSRIITTTTSGGWPGPAIIITVLCFAGYFLSKIGIKRVHKIQHQYHIEMIEKVNNQIRNKRIDIMLILLRTIIVFIALMYAYSVFIEQPKHRRLAEQTKKR